MSTTIYARGLVYCSVCTDDSDEVMLSKVNAENPTGLEGQWKIADEPFASGESNPTPCKDTPGCRHVLVVC